MRDVEEVANKDDHYFLRWLRVRKFNVAKAENMLREVSIRVTVTPNVHMERQLHEHEKTTEAQKGHPLQL